MPSFYLTPASISYLNQFLLALLITIYIGRRYFIIHHQRPSTQDRLLLFLFVTVSLFSLLLFLDVSLLPAERLYVVCAENSVLGILLVVLIQFAYYFPTPYEKQKYERWIVLALSTAYALWEVGFAIWRYYLLGQGQVIFRPPEADRPPIILFAWTIVVFARGAIKNWHLPACRQFALTFLIPVWLAWLNFKRTAYQISTPFFHINMSVGILLTIFLFALIFLTSQPEKTSFAAKFGGVMLTSMLAIFGIIGWLTAPEYAERYYPNIPDYRTLHYVANDQGGYDLDEIPFHFDSDLGQDIGAIIDYSDRTFVMEVDFDFPFFGNQYKTIYISNTGTVSMGESLDWKDLQFHFSNVPAIFALLVDLDPGKCIDCGIFLRKDPDQIVITYLNVPSLNNLSATYTFQIILYSEGSFDVTYNGLPENFKFYVDDRPEATAWAIGIKPAIAPSESVDLSRLPLQSGAGGLIQDEYRAFRNYLGNFLRPVAVAVVVGSLLVLITLSAVFHYGIAQPLDALLKGVQTLNSGQRDVVIPVKFNDEIGFLTESFNNLSHCSQVKDLNNPSR